MPQEFKIVVALALLAIVASLGKALFHLSSGSEQSAQTVRALTARIGLSIVLFMLLMAGWYFGLITPHSVGH